MLRGMTQMNHPTITTDNDRRIIATIQGSETLNISEYCQALDSTEMIGQTFILHGGCQALDNTEMISQTFILHGEHFLYGLKLSHFPYGFKLSYEHQKCNTNMFKITLF